MVFIKDQSTRRSEVFHFFCVGRRGIISKSLFTRLKVTGTFFILHVSCYPPLTSNTSVYSIHLIRCQCDPSTNDKMFEKLSHADVEVDYMKISRSLSMSPSAVGRLSVTSYGCVEGGDNPIYMRYLIAPPSPLSLAYPWNYVVRDCCA